MLTMVVTAIRRVRVAVACSLPCQRHGKECSHTDNIAHDRLIGDGGGGLYFDGCNPAR
jgi:hypothetical protein